MLSLAIGAVIVQRKRQRKAFDAAPISEQKPPLHSHDFQSEREELEGTVGKKTYDQTTMSELLSNEPVYRGKELPANEVVGTELDNRVRIPKTDLSCQSPKVGSGGPHK